jgi:hexokinase
MKKIKKKVRDFLRKNNMEPADINIDQLCQVFLDEMGKGLAGRKSSLAMLPTYIETEKEIPRNKPVIVMDAGGTNFRTATVYFADEGKAVVSDFKLFEMPGLKGKVGRKEFFGTMAGYIKHIADKSDSVGFCFSYPIEMYPSKDGRVLYFSKEIQAPQVEGQMIGENLNVAINESGLGGKKNIVLLNDTVATLLAGRADASGRTFDSFIGFILGTGTNCSYVEQNKNITKAKDYPLHKLNLAGSQIINIESGAFGKAPRGTIDRKFDKSLNNPGVNIFEKMISGAYLGPICLWTIQAAVKEKLFSNAMARKLLAITRLSSKEVSDFIYNPQKSDNPLSKAINDADEQDSTALYWLIDRMIERAAKLTAINLSSVEIKCGKGQNPTRPVCIVAEGTTFYHLTSLRQRVECYLKQHLVGKKGVFYEIINVENATLVGAAIAGLTNL